MTKQKIIEKLKKNGIIKNSGTMFYEESKDLFSDLSSKQYEFTVKVIADYVAGTWR